ncbi:MAG: GNAT family N-acetyltransferase [Desulfobacteraceae bacterium]|nr:MAG: GNAT family N-acetyltransferase [Desulfobacteraceae bacterium]
MPKIEYKVGAEELLDEVKPLWEKLNEQHALDSTHFSTLFRKRGFAERKESLLENKIAVRVEMARETNSGRLVGYCIGTVNQKEVGEIDSIFIDIDFRGMGIGDVFMRRALEWMETRAVQSKMLTVAEGNERVFAFYKRYGFYPRTIVLIHKP